MKQAVTYDLHYTPGMRIKLSKGNRKIGKIYNFNLLPGNKPISTKDKGPLTNVVGTCTGCCDGCERYCYAVRSAQCHHNVNIPAWGNNTLIVRNDLSGAFAQIKEELTKHDVKLLRYHSSGEIESYSYLEHMVSLANDLPNVHFYFYTKRFSFIEKYLKENGKFPENLVVNISEWNGNTAGYDLHCLNRFVYDDHTDPALEKVPHCPAIAKDGSETGVTCDKCGICWRKNNGHVVAVYDHSGKKIKKGGN